MAIFISARLPKPVDGIFFVCHCSYFCIFVCLAVPFPRIKMIRIILSVILLFEDECFSDPLNVVLIGFSSSAYTCYHYSKPFPNFYTTPTLTWHKNVNNAGPLGVTPINSSQESQGSFCLWRFPWAEKNAEIRDVINEIITNSTILTFARNSSQLVCVSFSVRFSPVLKWKSSYPNLQNLRAAVSIESVGPGCKNYYKTISILEIDRFPENFQCVVDKTATCAVQNNCHYQSLVGSHFGATVDENNKTKALGFNCSTPFSSLCSSISFDDERIFPNTEAIQHESVPQADLERLCRLIYPTCANASDPLAGVVPLCREDCYTIQMRYPEIWPVLTPYISKLYQPWTNCGQFPSVAGQEPCRQSSTRPLFKEKLSSHCYEKNDRHYIGWKNRTKNGHVCQKWNTLYPNYHEYWPELYAELINAENYCRNPGGTKQGPWCYTTVINVPWAFCTDVPLCSPQSTTIDQSMDRSIRSNRSNILLILSICGGAILLFAVFFVYVCQKRKSNPSVEYRIRYSRASDLYELADDHVVEMSQSNSSAAADAISNLPPNELYFQNEFGLDRRLEYLEIPRSNWTVIRKLASSEWNDMFLARYQSTIDFLQLSNRRLLAVKSLKAPSDPCVFENFIHEACVVASCDHHRIVRLVGVSFVGRPASILFEHVSLGDLKTVLEAEVAQDDLASELEHVRLNWNPPLSDNTRVADIAYQIADGMVYLSNQRIVHRDLAARNILVDERLQVKISDFGLSKRVDHVGGVYQAHERERLPVRWTAPEAWSTQCFSSKSDVWSYGVVIWEILSLGMQPYFGMSHQEVVYAVVAERKTLSAVRNPFQKQSRIDFERISVELMKPCFAYQPKYRPDFIILLSNAAKLRSLFRN